TIGYRNYSVRDESRNLIPLGLLLSGEELHNNHHKFPSSAKFSQRWFEFDMGWVYINLMKWVKLASIKVVHAGAPNFKLAKDAAVRAAHDAKERVHDAKERVIFAAENAKEKAVH